MPTTTPSDELQIIRPRDLADRLGVNTMTVWRWRQADPTFPTPVRLGQQSIGYLAREVRDWVDARRRVTAADSAAMAPRTKGGTPVTRRRPRTERA